MIAQPGIVRRIQLTTPRVGEIIDFRGSYVRVRRASSSTAAVGVRFNEAQGDAHPLVLGEGFEGWPFDRLVLSNAAQPGQWVELAIGGDATAARPEHFGIFPRAAQNDVNIVGQDAPVEVIGPDAGPVEVEFGEDWQHSGPKALNIWPWHPDGLTVQPNGNAVPFRVRRERWDVPSNWVDFDELQDVTGYTTFVTAGASGLTIYEARVSHDAIDARGGIEVVDDGGSPVMQLRALGRDHRIVSRGLWGLHLPESYSIRVRKNGSSSGAVQAVVEGFVGNEAMGSIL